MKTAKGKAGKVADHGGPRVTDFDRKDEGKL